MADPFRQHIQAALNNPALQAALDGNAERRRLARQQGYASLPRDLEALRREAHALRARTIANLEPLLQEFIVNARANGLIVHRAADASEAVAAVLEIAQKNDARWVAKAKSMLGEEIELNHALQTAGLEVVETDLGEYIVQLRGERPAHIITPAVHLRRADVAATFAEKLGVPYNDDVPTMTAIARRVLRQVFLEADLGISGVNFGVVESGTLCLLTNEGNGRMVTTLPRIHIALMGIERLVPTLEDLALLLALLPRSASGQKMTVYTTLINGPRRPGDLDGPAERHLILVDNGRRSLLGSELEESLLCIRCGACLNACPIFREIGGHGYVGVSGQPTPYPGPIGSVLSPALFGSAEFGNLARATSLCGACKEACPVDIDLPRLLLRVRAGMTASPSPARTAQTHAPASLRVALWFYSWFASSPGRYRLAQHLAAWFSRIYPGSSRWMRLPAITGWGLSRDFPRPALTTFRQRYARGQVKTPVSITQPAVSPATFDLQEKPVPDSVIRTPVEEHSYRDQFRQELVALGGQFIECCPENLLDKILLQLTDRGVHCLSAWHSPQLPAGLLPALQASGIEITHLPDPQAQAGLTGALAGVADLGAVLLVSGSDQALTPSLLPGLHLVILPASRIYPDLSFILSQGHPAREEIIHAPASVLICGPSRTADIEMTLTIGVHGPGEVLVFCLD
jgi:L-lactate dehydrogenase complex protein LldF